MTFIVDAAPRTDESLHYSPVEQAFWTEAEAIERVERVQSLLSSVGTEARGLILAHAYPKTREELQLGELELGDDEIPGTADRRIGVADVRKRLTPKLLESGVDPLPADSIGDAFVRYFVPTGLLEHTGRQGREHLYEPVPVQWEEAAASAGFLLDLAVRHNVSTAKLLGYGRNPAKNGGRTTSAAITRIGILAHVYRETTFNHQSVAPADIEKNVNPAFMSSSWMEHLDLLVQNGFVTERSSEDAPYLRQPEFDLSFDPSSTPEEPNWPGKQIRAAIIEMYESNHGEGLHPADIARHMGGNDQEPRDQHRMNVMVRKFLQEWSRCGLAQQKTEPGRAMDKVGLSYDQRLLVKELLETVDSMAIPTPEFIEAGLEKLYLVCSDSQVVAHLVQRTRANTPANHRKSIAHQRVELRRILSSEGTLSTGDLAKRLGINPRYAHRILSKMDGVSRQRDGRSTLWQNSS